MTFRNNLAAYLWGFSAIFLLFVSALTYVLIRDGAPSGFPPVIIAATMVIFWMGAVGFALFAVSKHCLCVTIHPDSRVSIIWRFPFKKEEKSVSRAEMSPATVFESIDNEGVSYFHGMPRFMTERLLRLRRVMIGRPARQPAPALMKWCGRIHLKNRRSNVGMSD